MSLAKAVVWLSAVVLVLGLAANPSPAQAVPAAGSYALFTFSHVGGQHPGILYAVGADDVTLSIGGRIIRCALPSVVRIQSALGHWVYQEQFRGMKFYPIASVDLNGLAYRPRPRSRFDWPPPRAGFSGYFQPVTVILKPLR